MPLVSKFNSSMMVNLRIEEYKIDWFPKREVSKPQGQVKRFLYPYWKHHIVTEETRIPGSRLRIDLTNWTTKICVEISPSSSHSFNKFFHKNEMRFSAATTRDLGKAAWIEKNGFTLVEIFDEDLKNLSPEWFLSKYDVTL